MNIVRNANQEWETQVIERFVEIVKAPYGDFSRIGQLSEAISDLENLQQVVEFLSRYPEVKRALDDRTRLGKVDLQQLHQLPKNTLGYVYAHHMIENGFAPPPTREVADNVYSFLGVHLSETHDIWHVVTGCDTNKAGEIQLQGFYAAQIYPSRFWVAMISKNLLKTAIEDIELSSQHLDALAKGWLLGKQARPLFGIRWNTLWEIPLETLRTQLNLNWHDNVAASTGA